MQSCLCHVSAPFNTSTEVWVTWEVMWTIYIFMSKTGCLWLLESSEVAAIPFSSHLVLMVSGHRWCSQDVVPSALAYTLA